MMKTRSLSSAGLMLLGAVIGASVLTPVVRAGVDVAISAEIRLGRALPPPPPEVVVIGDALPPGPPPWAPAHGFRRNRVYYYYPASGVYFRPSDRTWFYLEGGAWRFGVALPETISIDFGRSVSLTMETDRPYAHHAQVVTHYPAVYFGARVRLKDEPGSGRAENARASAGKPEGENGPGPGKGKGRGGKPDK